MEIKTVTKMENSDVSWRDSRCAIAIVCVFLIAITWFVFGQTVRYNFVNYDDDNYVYANPLISSGLTIPGAIYAFSGKHSGNWHPLTTLSHMLDCQLWGSHAGGHHFTNIVLHATAVVLLFLVLLQMTGALWRSAFVAAVFAIHPLRVESVAWISERKDVLSAVFFMLTIGAYVQFVRRPTFLRYLILSIFFALGLMSKPMLVTVPFVLLLLDYWPLRRFQTARSTISKLLLEKIPLLILAAPVTAVTVLIQRHGINSVENLSPPWGMADFSLRWPNGRLILRISAGFVLGLSMWRAWNQASFWRDSQSLWNHALTATDDNDLAHERLASALLDKDRPDEAIVQAQLAINLKADNASAQNDFGVALARRGQPEEAITHFWKALEADPNLSRLHYNIANVLVAKGDAAQATLHYQKQLEIDPNFAEAHNNFATLLLREGHLDQATDHLAKALQLKPNYAEARNNLAVALSKKGRMDEAVG